MRFHGRARVSSSAPQAFGICDRCGFNYNLVDLTYQFDWRGNTLTNLRIRVCAKCKDLPQDQLRPKVTPADPVPVRDPRPENYTAADAGSPAGTFNQPPNFGAIPE